MARVGSLFLYVSLVAAAPVSAQERACLHINDDHEGGLPRESVDNIMYRKVQIQRGGRDFFVETFSDMSPSAGLPGEHCLRWESVNASGEPIPSFFWPAGRMSVDPLRPGEEGRRTFVTRETYEPLGGDNKLYAFERSEAVTQSWKALAAPDQRAQAGSSSAVEDWIRPPISGAPSQVNLPYSFKWGSTVEMMPALEHAVPNLPVKIITFDPWFAEFPTMEHSFGSVEVNVRVVSSLDRREGIVSIVTRADAGGAGASEALYAFPGLRALEKTWPGYIADPEEALVYASSFDAIREEAFEEFQGYWEFTTEIENDPGVPLELYSVSHPVTIETGGGADCFLITSYSPIPVSFPLSYCAR